MNDPLGVFDRPDPKDDPRSVGELLSVLPSGPDEELYRDAVVALHWRGTREILDRAVQLCQSFCWVERRAGADVLGQLGVPDRSFPEQSLRILLNMLEGEENHDVLRSILVALSHHHEPAAIGPASRFRHHADPDVRHAVVLALTGYEDSQALRVLIELSRDAEPHVRDWATFALGSQVEADSPELRKALFDRLDDEDEDTRDEAIVGLAHRGDRRILQALSADLASKSIGRLTLEAAALIGDPQLHPLLVALKGCRNVNGGLLEDAIRACTPRSDLRT